MNTFEYKGYIGSCELDADALVLVGKLLFIRDVITYSATSVQDLKAAFEEAVDDYLASCAETGDKPDTPCKGSFNVRIDPDLHKRAATLARSRSQSLNDLVSTALQVACGVVQNHHVTVSFAAEEYQQVLVSAAPGVNQHWESVNVSTPIH